MISKNIIIATATSLLLLTGCATSSPNPSPANIQSKKGEKTKIVYINRDKPYKFNYVPIIGTQTPDDKVVVNMGVVLRVWIHSYKTRNDDLVASHDIYIWGKKPDFIVGNALPTFNRGVLTPQGKMPFMLSDSTVDRSNFKSNLNIRKFVNSVYAKKSGVGVEKQIQKSGKFDKEIKDFINSIKKEKK